MLAGACKQKHGAYLEGCIQALLVQHERHQSASRHAAIQHKPPAWIQLPSVAEIHGLCSSCSAMLNLRSRFLTIEKRYCIDNIGQEGVGGRVGAICERFFYLRGSPDHVTMSASEVSDTHSTMHEALTVRCHADR